MQTTLIFSKGKLILLKNDIVFMKKDPGSLRKRVVQIKSEPFLKKAGPGFRKPDVVSR
jgi:hypothetical protein